MKNLKKRGPTTTRWVLFSVICAMFFAVVSCSQKQDSDVADASIREASTANIKSIHSTRLENMKKGKYNLSHVNLQMIKEGMKNVKSEAEMVELWKKAGMTNAEEYFLSIKSQMREYSKVLNTDPEMKSWSNERKKAYIRSTLESNRKVAEPNSLIHPDKL